MSVLLRNASLADGSVLDVRLDGPLIGEVGPALAPGPDEEVHDLDGWLLLPAPAEPHAHLDKALTADLVANPTGDLLGAVMGWQAVCGDFTVDDIAGRARIALLRLLASGCTAVRSHVNVGSITGLCAVEAMLQVRADVAHLMDLQLVALIASPTDPGLLREALDMGIDVVGGCPHLDPDPMGCIDTTVGLAAERGLAVDLHTDETLDVDTLWVRELGRAVRGAGLSVTASHCVSLGMQDPGTQAKVADELAEAGVAVVTLPQTNLFLQARGITTAAPRGLTAIRPLLDAGVTVAGGADNLQDPFITVGRADPLETAALLVMAGHLAPVEAYELVTTGARAAMGLAPVRIEPGAPAELLAVQAPSVRIAVADAPAGRLVFAKGRLVARTTVERSVYLHE
jgi:cytosine deaminase